VRTPPKSPSLRGKRAALTFRVEVVVPALPALLARAVAELLGDDGPVAGAVHGDEVHELLVLLAGPAPLAALLHSLGCAAHSRAFFVVARGIFLIAGGPIVKPQYQQKRGAVTEKSRESVGSGARDWSVASQPLHLRQSEARISRSHLDGSGR
jgi:hypothetical protein